ncbi:Thiol:disulfide interchange protein DsbD precursor [Planctomycetes bacterium Poly30]|uniref:Thiol:disulfide interchange protein DsbD n=1 Tax=Saltatorellus ferox TaxID=2528018 RepID=A0A518F136_9BACT|nr:Thiol:disulfide interchange protein DsbD precursor [Planctomycetes bacterium Poly30]
MNRPTLNHIVPRLARVLALSSLCLAVLLGAARPVLGQTASSKLFAKVQGEDLLVAIQVTPDFGCWFYDDGPGEVGGQPTQVTMGEIDGAVWTPVWFPEPKVKYDESIDWTSKIFDKATVLYAAAPGVGADFEASDVTAEIVGQVCDKSVCVPWSESLTFRSEGTDAIWAGFPPALLVGEEALAPSEVQVSEEVSTAAAAPVWKPFFADDAKAMSRAFARSLEDDRVELVIQVATPEHWHMYGGPEEKDKGPGVALPTTITVEGGNVDWEPVHFPEPFRYVQIEGADDGWVWAYKETFYFGVQGEAYDEFDPESIVIHVDGQSCDDASCVFVNMTPEVEGEGEPAMYAAAFAEWTRPEESGADAADASATSTEAPKQFGQDTTSDSLWGFILLAIGAGLFTLLMPCTYPMIPITISYFTKQADDRGGKVLPLALAYGAGIVAIFVILGAALGPVMVDVAASWITNVIIGVIFVVFALSLFGMIDLRPPGFMMKFAGNASKKGGYLGVFLMGLTLVVTSFTCTGPFVGSLIAGGAATGGVMRVALGMGAFGLTMATPFVVLALLPGRMSAMPSAGAWMNTLKVFMGFVELAASLKFFSNADIALHLMVLPREVFLMLWAAIAFVAGYYLLGRVNLKGECPDGEIGPGRLMAAIVTVSGGFYCVMGAMGYQLDGLIMSAMAPPPTYSRGLVETHTQGGGSASALPDGVKMEAGSYVVVDDYDLAREFALSQGLDLIANFTAHT